MLLKTAMSLCESLSRLTMMLSKRPDLTRQIRNVDADDRKSIAETSAEIIQKIFTTCLTDRSSTRYSKPEGKKVGVYMFANLVLKLLFAVSQLGHIAGDQILTIYSAGELTSQSKSSQTSPQTPRLCPSTRQPSASPSSTTSAASTLQTATLSAQLSASKRPTSKSRPR